MWPPCSNKKRCTSQSAKEVPSKMYFYTYCSILLVAPNAQRKVHREQGPTRVYDH